jgi:hypothetical protein
MASAITPQERSRRMVNTAACIIIGDEVLGGKVRIQSKQLPFGRGKGLTQEAGADNRHQLVVHGPVLLLVGY